MERAGSASPIWDRLGGKLTAEPVGLLGEDDPGPGAGSRQGGGTAATPAADNDQVGGPFPGRLFAPGSGRGQGPRTQAGQTEKTAAVHEGVSFSGLLFYQGREQWLQELQRGLRLAFSGGFQL